MIGFDRSPLVTTISTVTSNLNIKLADLGEARFFNDSDPRKLPRFVHYSFIFCFDYNCSF